MICLLPLGETSDETLKKDWGLCGYFPTTVIGISLPGTDDFTKLPDLIIPTPPSRSTLQLRLPVLQQVPDREN